MSAPALQLVPNDRAPVTPPKGGRPMTVEEVQALLPRRPDGKPVSRYWVTHKFAPKFKHRTGRVVWWWEADVYRELDRDLVRRAG